MRLKILFENHDQSKELKNTLIANGNKLGDDYTIDRETERFLEI